MSDKSLTDRWWDTFNAALTGILAYPGCEFEWAEANSKKGKAREIANNIHGPVVGSLPGEQDDRTESIKS